MEKKNKTTSSNAEIHNMNANRFNPIASGSRGNERPKSFAEIANAPKLLSNENDTFPVKEQGILLPALSGVSVETYVNKLSEIIQPENIIFAQKIKNNRISIYLKTKDDVDNLIKNNQTLNIENETITIRRLINPAKRIIISGGAPIVPHISIEKELLRYQIQLTTGITFLKAGYKKTGLQHIHSFSRHFYANLPEDFELPPSILVSHEKETYCFYLTNSESCYKCRREGHQVKDCPLNIQPNEELRTISNQNSMNLNKNNLTQEKSTESIRTQPQIISINPDLDIETNSQAELNLTDQNIELSNDKTNTVANLSLVDSAEEEQGVESVTQMSIVESSQPEINPTRDLQTGKRPRTSTTDTTTDESDPEKPEEVEKFIKPAAKKKNNKKKTIPIEDMLGPLEETLKNHSEDYQGLNLTNLKAYIVQTKGCKNIPKLTKEHFKIESNMELALMLEKLQPILEHHSIKGHFTKIINILVTNNENLAISANETE